MSISWLGRSPCPDFRARFFETGNYLWIFPEKRLALMFTIPMARKRPSRSELPLPIASMCFTLWVYGKPFESRERT